VSAAYVQTVRRRLLSRTRCGQRARLWFIHGKHHLGGLISPSGAAWRYHHFQTLRNTAVTL